MWDFILSNWNGFYQLGLSHNVNPLVFASLYIGTIPPYILCFGWLIQAKRKAKPLTLPMISTLFFFILPALYILLFGENVAWWVYTGIGLIISISLYHFLKRIQPKQHLPES